jgi:hypothetical protein
MLFADEKRKLLGALINQRIEEKDFTKFAQTIGIAAPAHILERWKGRFYAVNEIEFKEQFKTINKFCLGADPEFVFQGTDGGDRDSSYVFSQQLGLNTLEAFGADMTGRQAELRAWPNRSALFVVASLVDTLRWMTIRYPATMKYKWIANAFFGGDGVGGHIHFGRKRGDRDASIKSLDNLTSLLTYTGAVDGPGQLSRLAGTRYGRPGDIRVQPHGYEYRTMPTWMASPWSAFLTLTLAKLCVFHHLNVPKIKVLQDSLAGNITQITTLLQAFANADDDARIALIGIKRMGIPKYPQFSDFKAAWGIVKVDPLKEVDKVYFPPIIEPSDHTVRELFDFIVNGKAITFKQLKPTWKVFKLDADVHKINIEAHRPGVPEVASGILSKGVKVSINGSRLEGSRGWTISVPPTISLDKAAIKEALKKRKGTIRTVSFNEGSNNTLSIQIPGTVANNWVVNKDVVADIRWLLCKTGLFPIAKAEMVDKIDVSLFVKKKDGSIVGKILYQVQGEAELQQANPGNRG